MQTLEGLEEELKKLIIEALVLEDLEPGDIQAEQALFVEGLGLDSIDALELAVSMEKTFGVSVPNSEVATKALQSVNTIHDYILEKRAAPTP